MQQTRILYHAISQLLQQEHTLGDIIDLLGELGGAQQGRRILKVVRVEPLPGQMPGAPPSWEQPSAPGALCRRAHHSGGLRDCAVPFNTTVDNSLAIYVRWISSWSLWYRRVVAA